MKRIVCFLTVLCMLFITNSISENGFSTDTARINEAAASVVVLEQKDEGGNVTARASGFAAIMPSLLITSASFVQLGTNISAVTDNGETLCISGILGCNTDSDVAILALEDSEDELVPLAINEGKHILRGSDCVVIGAQGKDISVSIGNMSGFFKDSGINLIQFTAPLSVGSGGSPLFDEDGEVAGITTGSYVDGTGVVQNLNFAVDISEALALYEIVKDDVVAPLSDWEITDVGTKRYTNPEPPMEFYIENDAYGITEIYLFQKGKSMGRSRISEAANIGDMITIKVSQEEFESDAFWQIKIVQSGWDAYNYLSLPYPMSYLLGNTFVFSKYSKSADSTSMLFDEKEQPAIQRRHMAEGTDPQSLKTLPANCIVIKNDTDLTMIELSFANLAYNNFLSPYGANNMLYSGHKLAVFLPDTYLTGVETYDLRVILYIDRFNTPTYTWKIKAEDLLGKTLHFYKDENGKVTFDAE